jgi:hypothetical protein
MLAPTELTVFTETLDSLGGGGPEEFTKTAMAIVSVKTEIVLALVREPVSAQ